MNWDARRRAMLEEMGLHMPPVSVPVTVAPTAARAPDDSMAAAGRSAPAPPVDAPPPRPVPLPRQREIAAMNWSALRESVAHCTACALCRGRTHTVFGCGNPSAHWMIVGEAPGEQEDLRGEPFVGRSGQLLDRMLRALQLTRAASDPARQVYIANTLKCRPPSNRNPLPAELEQCEPFLIRQIELVAPRVIVAMGRFAVQALLRSTEPIGRLRGRVHRYHGVPLVVTYHPAYLLRNPRDKARAWDDLCLAREVANSAPGQAVGREVGKR